MSPARSTPSSGPTSTSAASSPLPPPRIGSSSAASPSTSPAASPRPRASSPSSRHHARQARQTRRRAPRRPRLDRQVDHVLRRPLPERGQQGQHRLRRFPDGRNAFYKWIYYSLAEASRTTDGLRVDHRRRREHAHDGPSNWILNGYITGGPAQDVMDQSAAFVIGHLPGHDVRQLRPVPQRPRPPRPDQLVGRTNHPLPGLAARVLHVEDQLHPRLPRPRQHHQPILAHQYQHDGH